jgi:hypothetical protein
MDDLIQKMSVTSFTDATVSYDIDIVLNTCTCMKWKYQRLPVAQRTCKHLARERERQRERGIVSTPKTETFSITTYPPIHVEDTYFQLFSHHIPDTLNYNDYVYSIKYDGIRIRITGNQAITRGGITIDLTGMAGIPFDDTMTEWDAELIHLTKPGHNNVMIELYANRVNKLSVRVFDVIDTTQTFGERQARLVQYVPTPFRVQYKPIRDRKHLSIVVKEILGAGEEGVVVRNLNGKYEPGHRSRFNAFKVKRII